MRLIRYPLTLLVACTLLSGCALAGLEGPERQAQAQQALRDLPGQVAQLPGDIVGSGGGGDYTPSYDSRLNEIQRQNARIESDLERQRLQEQQAEFRQQQWQESRIWTIYRCVSSSANSTSDSGSSSKHSIRT
jgi:hypothetical protein